MAAITMESAGNLVSNTTPKPATTTVALTPEAPTLSVGEIALLKALRDINSAVSSNNSPIKSQEIYNFLLQLFGILAATVFGIFSILAWLAADKANAIAHSSIDLATQSNDLATQSNTLAILAYCISFQSIHDNTAGTNGLCDNILDQAAGDLAPIVESVLPDTPTSTINSSPSLTTGSPSASTTAAGNTTSRPPSGATTAYVGPIVGGVIGGFATAILLGWFISRLPLQTYREKLRRSRENTTFEDSEFR